MFGYIKAHVMAAVVAAILIVIALTMFVKTLKHDPTANFVFTQVERGDVKELVAVSGVVEATDTAELAFPQTGIVAQILTAEGSTVEAGDLLASLQSGTLMADLTDAQAARASAVASRDELVSGPTSEAKAVTNTTVAIKREALERTIKEQNTKVENARRALLSNDLFATTGNESEDATAPTISGTYACDEEGIYELDVFRSGTRSGYSYTLSGLESGTAGVPTEQSAPLGTCGLRIQFTDGDAYGSSHWEIHIPNKKSSTYTTYKNAYDLAIAQAENAIDSARQDLELAEQQQILENAEPRSEAIARANATIAQTDARIARINAQLKDLTITAPFAGTITDVTVLPGETVTTAPIITLLADTAFELTARIPEIDITKVAVGQRAEVIFDARSEEVQDALITFISPLATEIDGVAYYEAKLQLIEQPSWLRSGLNADVDIIVDEARDVLRLPKRFVTEEEDATFSVAQFSDEQVTHTSVDVGIIGNDGFIEVIGLSEGETVVAP